MGILDGLFGGGVGSCPAPAFPDDDIILPPIPTPGPDVLPEPEIIPAPPTRAELREAAEQSATDAEAAIRDDLCEECLICLALAGVMGIPPWQPYGDTRSQRVGYAYQHYIVHWFHHDSTNRFISEWNYAGVWFDGLDAALGGMLATRAVSRSEYDPEQTSVCYLIDCKWGYQTWVIFDPETDTWGPDVPPFMLEKLLKELTGKDGQAGQIGATTTAYPSTALVWIFSSRQFKRFVESAWLPDFEPVLRTAYAPYSPETEFSLPLEESAPDLYGEN